MLTKCQTCGAYTAVKRQSSAIGSATNPLSTTDISTQEHVAYSGRVDSADGMLPYLELVNTITDDDLPYDYPR